MSAASTPSNKISDWARWLRNRSSSGVVLFVVAFIARVAYVIVAGRRTRFELDRAGVQLVLHGSIGNVLGPLSGPSAHLVPLPVVLRAGIEWMFGPISQASWFVAAMVMCAVSAWAIALVPKLARKLEFSETAGLITAFVLALHPFRLWGDSEPGHETALVTLALVGVILAFVDVHKSRWQDRRSIAWLSVVCGISALLSPPVLLAGLSLIALDLVSASGARSRVLVGGSVVVATVALSVLPWVVRNYALFGTFIPFRSNFGLELHIGNNPLADGRTYSKAFETIHPFPYEPERDILKKIGEVAYMRAKLETAKKWIRENPRAFVRLCLRRIELMWFLPVEMWGDARSPFWALLRALWYGTVGVLALLELLRLWWLRHPTLPLILVVIVAYSAVYWITHVDVRYAHPLDWLRTLLAAQLLIALAQTARAWRSSTTSARLGR